MRFQGKVPEPSSRPRISFLETAGKSLFPALAMGRRRHFLSAAESAADAGVMELTTVGISKAGKGFLFISALLSTNRSEPDLAIDKNIDLWKEQIGRAHV